ncbi:hypothetical protein [Cerasicoccus frondis]|uniref:hypothetical protein n=1 Tax=Cerasicoccus frondis TaxID=490090 RepID=UPI0028524D75|nr:hypothetical protein [Cerasicoccus frondis]
MKAEGQRLVVAASVEVRIVVKVKQSVQRDAGGNDEALPSTKTLLTTLNPLGFALFDEFGWISTDYFIWRD